MSINLTLIGQAISFALFVWFCMRFVWPPIINALEERKKKIADGLADADAAAAEREQAAEESRRSADEAKQEAATILGRAQKRADEIIEEARGAAQDEGVRIRAQAQTEAEQELQQAREQLRSEVAGLAVLGAEAVLKREVDAATHAKALDELATRL